MNRVELIRELLDNEFRNPNDRISQARSKYVDFLCSGNREPEEEYMAFRIFMMEGMKRERLQDMIDDLPAIRCSCDEEEPIEYDTPVPAPKKLKRGRKSKKS